MVRHERLDTFRQGDRKLARHFSSLSRQAEEMLPKVSGIWMQHKQFLVLLYDELAGALGSLDDYGFAHLQNTACRPMSVSETLDGFLQVNALMIQLDDLFGPGSSANDAFRACVWGFHLLKFHAAVGFCREKFLPAAKKVIQAAGPEAEGTHITRQLVKDLTAMSAVFDFRNALAHWNCSFDGSDRNVVFYSKRERDGQGANDVEYLRKVWTLDQAYFMTDLAMWVTMVLLLALGDEEIRRSGRSAET